VKHGNENDKDLSAPKSSRNTSFTLQLHSAMDPFSIVVGVGSLIQMSLLLGKYLKDVYESGASFEGEIGSLLHGIEDLESLNKSIEHLHRAETGMYYTSGHSEPPPQDLEIWQITVKSLKACSETVERLQ